MLVECLLSEYGKFELWGSFFIIFYLQNYENDCFRVVNMTSEKVCVSSKMGIPRNCLFPGFVFRIHDTFPRNSTLIQPSITLSCFAFNCTWHVVLHTIHGGLPSCPSSILYILNTLNCLGACSLVMQGFHMHGQGFYTTNLEYYMALWLGCRSCKI